ncbi:homeodomain-interacting protein kinase 2-like [Cebidichthys violaceus]|uniref:homeodomain-interacting protein kinase 2-like n=1 Tax=Cebidichthys violaceus TaxID=271503 RepID=UPI0035CC161A
MANKPPINRISGNYKILNVLGQGCYGDVVECFKRDTEETVAVKVVKQRNSRRSNMREMLVLEQLRCLDPDESNIVRCLEWFHRSDRSFMVFEKLDMSLHEYMTRRKWVPMPLDGIKTVIRDVATALSALKGLDLIHTDLKLDNVLLVHHQTQPFRVKVIDFGLCLETSEASPHLCVQPICYRSPEVILGLSFTEAIDIWSLGLVMAELLLGFRLFPGKHVYDTLRFMVDLLGDPPNRLLDGGINTGLFCRGTYKYRMFRRWTLMTPMDFQAETGIKPSENRRHQFSSLDDLKTLSAHQTNTDAADRNACVELLKRMLQMDPRNRITPNNILAHPFITRSTGNSCRDETLPAATSWSQAISNKDVIVVLPAEKTTQSCHIMMIADSVISGILAPDVVQKDFGHQVHDVECD